MKYFSLKEIAEKLGITRQAVWYKVTKGQLKAKKVGKIYVVSEKELKEYFSTNQKKD